MDTSYDTVVIGSGIAGLSAALASAERGLKTVLFEKDGVLGGGTAHSYGLLWVGSNHLEIASGYKDTREDTLNYLQFIAAGAQTNSRMEAFVDSSPVALAFLESCGLPLRIVRGVTDHYFDNAPGSSAEGRTLETTLIRGADLGVWQDKIRRPLINEYHLTPEELISWGGMSSEASWDADLMDDRRREDLLGLGVGLVARLVKLLLEREVEIYANTKVQRLTMNVGRVVGVELADGTKIDARKGVVMASGGYESNPKMVQNYEGLPNSISMFPDSIAGDGLVMASEQGGAIEQIHNNNLVFLGFLIPGGDDSTVMIFREASIIEMCSPHTMVVNRTGNRFGNEAHFQYIAPRLRDFDAGTRRLSNLPCYLVFDQQYADRYSFGGFPVGKIPGWVAQSDTLEGLATQLGIDKLGLKETAARLNHFAETGVDEDYGRGTNKWRLAQSSDDTAESQIGSIFKAPFYGIELMPSPNVSAGLSVNERAQVIHQRGHVIEGLYASGNAAAHGEYGVGYQHGLSLMSSVTFGYLAAQHMAAPETTAGSTPSQ